MRKWFFTLALLAVPALSASAQQTMTFEDASQDDSPVPNGYHGLNWSNWYFMDATNFGSPGYGNGRHSGDWVAFAASGTPTQTLQGASPFTLNSGWFSSAWNDDMQFDVTGYVGGVASYFQTAMLQTSGGAQLLTFDWTNLSSVTFAASGGVNAGYGGRGTHFTVDDLAVDNPITATPEPASMMLLATGLVGVFGVARLRRKTEHAA